MHYQITKTMAKSLEILGVAA